MNIKYCFHRRRDGVLAQKLVDKVVDVVTCSSRHQIRKRSLKDNNDESPESIAAASPSPSPSAGAMKEFWKLDVWEDDARRRRRLVRNPIGSTHPEATLKVKQARKPEKHASHVQLKMAEISS